jgi:hypothetical protein
MEAKERREVSVGWLHSVASPASDSLDLHPGDPQYVEDAKCVTRASPLDFLSRRRELRTRGVTALPRKEAADDRLGAMVSESFDVTALRRTAGVGP